MTPTAVNGRPPARRRGVADTCRFNPPGRAVARHHRRKWAVNAPGLPTPPELPLGTMNPAAWQNHLHTFQAGPGDASLAERRSDVADYPAPGQGQVP